MPHHTGLLRPRHRGMGWTVLTGVILATSLFPGPAAHAGDGGLLDDVTEVTDVAGAVTAPVVDPALEAAQTAVPPVEQAVEPVAEQVVEPTVSKGQHAVEEAAGGDGGPVPESKALPQGGVDGPDEGPDGEPATAAEPVTASQPPDATQIVPVGQGSGDDTGEPARGDAQGNAAADRARGRQRPSAPPCDGVSGLPPRGTATSVVQLRRDVRSGDVDEAGWRDTRPDDRSDGFREFTLPGRGGPTAPLALPDGGRALWLTGLVGLVIMLAVCLTVVLVCELE